MLAQISDHGRNDCVPAIRSDRFIHRDGKKRTRIAAPGKPDIQAGLQFSDMLASGLSAARIIVKVSRVSINLPGDENQHVFGRFLVDAHDSARMAKVCELNREPEPVGGAPPLTDQRHILRRECVMAYDRGRVRRWIKQRRARLRREDFVLFHAAPLFVLVAAFRPFAGQL
jgi:hypothetical protein